MVGKNLKARGLGIQPFLSLADLFAGLGGIRMGFENAARKYSSQSVGGQGVEARCVLTCEYDKFAQSSYEANFNTHSGNHLFHKEDIRTLPDCMIPTHNVLLAGFPCQPFSIAGVSKKNSMGVPHGFECEKQGNLFYEVVRFIKKGRPRAFLLENVKNLKSHGGGETFKEMLQTLRNISFIQGRRYFYDIHHEVLDASSLVPQHRERLFIAGFLSSTELPHSEPRSFDWGSGELSSEGKPTPVLSSILAESAGTVAEDPPHYADMKKYTLNDKLWNYLENYALKHRSKGNGFGRGLFSPDQRARTLSSRYYKDGADILIRQGGSNPRRLTPRECARIMGFPDSYKIVVSDSRAYRLFGNSVVVKLIEHIALRMYRAMEERGLLHDQIV